MISLIISGGKLPARHSSERENSRINKRQAAQNIRNMKEIEGEEETTKRTSFR